MCWDVPYSSHIALWAMMYVILAQMTLYAVNGVVFLIQLKDSMLGQL